MIALSVGTFVVNIGLMLGALYHKRELLVPWLVYYTLLFVFCFFVRLPAVDEEVSKLKNSLEQRCPTLEKNSPQMWRQKHHCRHICHKRHFRKRVENAFNTELYN